VSRVEALSGCAARREVVGARAACCKDEPQRKAQDHTQRHNPIRSPYQEPQYTVFASQSTPTQPSALLALFSSLKLQVKSRC